VPIGHFIEGCVYYLVLPNLDLEVHDFCTELKGFLRNTVQIGHFIEGCVYYLVLRNLEVHDFCTQLKGFLRNSVAIGHFIEGYKCTI